MSENNIYLPDEDSFNKLYKIELLKIDYSKMILNRDTSKWCLKSYPGHPEGCPNYGKSGCPPNVPYILDKYPNITKEFPYGYLVYLIFDFKIYKEIMRKLNPDISEPMIKNVIFYQNRLKNKLRIYIQNLIEKNDIRFNDYHLFNSGSGITLFPKTHVEKETYSMEACGINVYTSVRKHNIPNFEPRPQSFIHFFNLLCLKEELGKTKTQEMF